MLNLILLKLVPCNLPRLDPKHITSCSVLLTIVCKDFLASCRLFCWIRFFLQTCKSWKLLCSDKLWLFPSIILLFIPILHTSHPFYTRYLPFVIYVILLLGGFGQSFGPSILWQRKPSSSYPNTVDVLLSNSCPQRAHPLGNLDHNLRFWGLQMFQRIQMVEATHHQLSFQLLMETTYYNEIQLQQNHLLDFHAEFEYPFLLLHTILL